MNKTRTIAGVAAFGSIWGLLECLLGNYLPGAVMAGLIAFGLMALSRSIYQKAGIQLAMGIVAGILMATVPIGECVLCSIIAVIAEAVIFEIIWLVGSITIKKEKSTVILLSTGIVSGYLCYMGGYLTTQIITPLVASASFKLSEIVMFLPQILFKSTLAGVLGGLVLPTVAIIPEFRFSTIREEAYYLTVGVIVAMCWIIALFIL